VRVGGTNDDVLAYTNKYKRDYFKKFQFKGEDSEYAKIFFGGEKKLEIAKID
jgi:hypothetical protein